jgi:hypothetical protein
MQKLSIFFIYTFILVGTLSFSTALTLEKDSIIDLKFPCTYNGTNCPLATQCNISVIYPNQSLMVENQPTTYTGSGIANYTLPDSSVNGEYKVPITCTFPDGISKTGNADFTITPNGEIPSIAQTSIYLGLIALLLVLFILIIFALFNIDNFGWRMGLTSFAYIIANGFLLICWKTAEMFLTSVPFIETIFKILYMVSTAGYFPMILFVLIYSLLHMTDQKNIETLMNRGFTEDQARWRLGKK